jgi:hypothetical protein
VNDAEVTQLTGRSPKIRGVLGTPLIFGIFFAICVIPMKVIVRQIERFAKNGPEHVTPKPYYPEHYRKLALSQRQSIVCEEYVIMPA